jgi:integrase/recombinase XerD
MNLRDALAEFCTAKATKCTPSTIDWYRVQIGAFSDWLEGQMDSGQITYWFAPATFESYYLYLKNDPPKGRGLQPASLRGAHRALTVFFGWLTQRKHPDGSPYIPSNPLKEVEAPYVPKREPRRTQPEEYEQLLASIPLASHWVDARDYLMVSTLFLCGVRVAELCRLTIADYDVSNRLLKIRKKGGDDHVLPLLEPVIRAFIAYLSNRPAWKGSEVFLSCDGWTGADGVMTTNGVRQRLTMLCERAGVQRLTPHRFRHGLARYMLDQGANMALIQRILGHQRLSTTADIYAIWDNLSGVTEQYNEIMAEIAKRKPPSSSQNAT